MARGGYVPTLGMTVGQARHHVRTIFWLGALLMVLGLVIAGLAWPRTQLQFDASAVELVNKQTGDSGWAFIGLGVAGIGQLFSLVALIAWGVRYGIESAKSEPEPEFTDDEEQLSQI